MSIRRMLFVTSLAGAGLLGLAGGAQATPITNASDFTISWDLAIAGHPDVMATAQFSNFSFIASNKVQFTLDVTNTTANGGSGAYSNDRFTSFGWDTSPLATAVTDTTAVYASTTNVSLGPDHVSVCFYSGPNCNGGGNGGVESSDLATISNPSTTGSLTVTLTFGTSSVPPLDFSNFDGKFQTSAGSVEGYGTCTSGCDPAPVPEPMSLTLLGSSLLGLGFILHRSRRHG